MVVGIVAAAHRIRRRELAYLAQEIAGLGCRGLGVIAAAGEQEPGEIAIDVNGRRHDVESQVALVHHRGGDEALGLGRALPAAQAIAHCLDALVAAAKALFGKERQAAQLVVGRNDLALRVIQDVALAVGKG